MWSKIFLVILVIYGFRILKKLFSPAVHATNNSEQRSNSQQFYETTSFTDDVSGEVEDIDYEEVE